MFRKFFAYLWGTITHPGKTFDLLAQERSIRPAVMLAIFALLCVWLNYLLYRVFGYDWLGTRRELSEPTYVGFFGHLPVGLEHYVPLFLLVISPLLALLGLFFMPGLVHVLSKLWRGQATFEQMVNTIGFAQLPSILIQGILNDMLLAGIPLFLLTGHPYPFTAAMNGEFGSFVAALWWVYMIGIYIIGTQLWIVILGTIAITRIQRIPCWAAVLIMLFAYNLWFFGLAGSIVR